MSAWDPYIDSLIQHGVDESGEKNVDLACIIGKDNSKWTSDAHACALKLNPDEIAAIVRAFNSKDFSYFQVNGVKIGGQVFRFLRSDDDLILAKQKDHGALVIQCSQTAVVIAHTPEGKQQGKTNYAVSKITDYLSSVGM